jgi:hypothetical protein
VSSLWEVDDQATYALMLLFYRKLWADGQVSGPHYLRLLATVTSRPQVSTPGAPGVSQNAISGSGMLVGSGTSTGKALIWLMMSTLPRWTCWATCSAP